jgi:hypothetical protein
MNQRAEAAYRLVAAGAALAARPLHGVGHEAVAAALGVVAGLARRVAVRVHRRLLDASARASGTASSAGGVAVVRRRPGVGVGRHRRRVAGPALVARRRGRGRRPPRVGRRRGHGGGVGLRVLGGVVGVDHLAALALARVLEVERVRHIPGVVPVAELGDLRLVLLLHSSFQTDNHSAIVAANFFPPSEEMSNVKQLVQGYKSLWLRMFETISLQSQCFPL